MDKALSNRLNFVVPPPRDRFSVFTADGAEIKVRVHGEPGRPRLILSHGNGFAINGYQPLWQLFLHDFELVLFDFRNHGENTFAGPQHHDWRTFVDDFDRVLKAVDATLPPAQAVGMFHSLSAITGMIHAIEYSRRWPALVLFEPPLLPPPDHLLHQPTLDGQRRVAAWAQSRPYQFKSPEDLAHQWEEKGAFRKWVDGAHSLMARSVLRRDPGSDEYVLVCPRELEAKIYVENDHPHLWGVLPALGNQVLILGSDRSAKGNAPGKVARALSDEFRFDYAEIPRTTHLLMIEQPEICARVIRQFLLSSNVAASAHEITP